MPDARRPRTSQADEPAAGRRRARASRARTRATISPARHAPCRPGGCRGRATSSAGGRPWGRRPAGAAAALVTRERLDRVRHRVAVGGVAVPGLERHHGADLVADEAAPPPASAGSKRRIVPTWSMRPLASTACHELLALRDGDAERLLDQHVLARRERPGVRLGTWNGVGDGDDHGLDRRDRRASRRRSRRCASAWCSAATCVEQVGRDVADRVELGVAQPCGTPRSARAGRSARAEDADRKSLRHAHIVPRRVGGRRGTRAARSDGPTTTRPREAGAA